VPGKKFIVTNLNYISCKKFSMGYIVESSILFGVFNCFGDGFYPNNFLSQLTYKNTNTAGTTIQVIYGFAAC